MKKRAQAIQICGTGSGVGKSILAAGLCRLFKQDGVTVAPFKAQNMALNSAVTRDGLEIGRAQAMQAAACGLEPTADMNPILLKPTGDMDSQVIVGGRPVGNMTAMEYYSFKSSAFDRVKKSLERLMGAYDLVVIEGAGSPAEINLKKHDIVNMKIASLINAPVILAGDIDRGGVFAWLVGTLQLLEESEKNLVKGFIINKFRGDKRLLEEGLTFLEEKTQKKVVGVVPYFTNIKLPEEDSLFFDQYRQVAKTGPQDNQSSQLHVVVVRLPHISNFTDFDVFQGEEDVTLEYTTKADDLQRADCVIIPGTKNTLSDLQFLYDQGLAAIIRRKAQEGAWIIGICGGYQMLGTQIVDEDGLESGRGAMEGLGLLKVETSFAPEKCTYQVEGTCLRTGLPLRGYEIHHGRTQRFGCSKPLFRIERSATGERINDGTVDHEGKIWGTYIHGIFDNHELRRQLLNIMREKKGLALQQGNVVFSLDGELDALADLLRGNLNMQFVYSLIEGVSGP